jgi:PadR family transcriptional regulator, regulatory protein AphA
MEDLNPTARAVLGVLSFGPMSGYDIKAFVDTSIRFFWAASYGSIYPELKRLEAMGLVSATDDATGGRRRTVYALTDAGTEALRAWVASDESLTYELRDEGLLKLFLATNATPGDEAAVVRQMLLRHQETLDQVRALGVNRILDPQRSPSRVEAYGLALHEFTTDWLARLERELADDTKE